MGSVIMTKPFPSISIQALDGGDPSAVESLAQSLVKNGFGVIRLDGDEDPKVLRESLLQCQSMGEFRFPPVDEPVEYQEQHKACFEVLFSFKSLLEQSSCIIPHAFN